MKARLLGKEVIMRKLKLIASAALALALVSPGAQATTGNELKGWCEGAATGICNAYVMGVVHGFTIADQRYGGGEIPYCPPDGVTFGQMGLVVIKYLEDHPEELHLPAPYLVVMSLMEAFPCEE